MGRIKGPSSVFRERLVEKQPSYTVGQPNYLREGLKDIGAILQVSKEIYQNPLLKDAAAGLFDLFSSDKKGVVETVKKANEAEQMKKAAISRRASAMKDMEEARPPVGPPQGPVEMPDMPSTTPELAKAQEEKARLEAAMADPMKREALEAQKRMLQDKYEDTLIDAGDFKNYIKDISGGKSLPQIEQERDSALESVNTSKSLAKDAERQAYIAYFEEGNREEAARFREQAASYNAQAEEFKKAADDAQQLINNINEARDQLAASGKVSAETYDQMTALEGEMTAPTKRIAELDKIISAESKKLGEETQRKVNEAVERIMSGNIKNPEIEAGVAAMAKKLDSMSDSDAMMLAGDPKGQVLYEVAKRRALAKTGEFAMGGDIGSAMAALEEEGVDISPEPTETAPERTAPAEPGVTPTPTEEVSSRLIQDTPLADVSPAERARLVDQVKGRLLTDFEGAAPQINAVFEQLRSQYGDDALGSTPGEVESNVRKIMQGLTQGMGQAVPEGGIQVPDISGMSIQEAENVAMEIAASNASMSAKTAAMRQLLGQAGNIDDVVPAWMARGGTLGYLDRDMAADRLRKAFTGMMPKPKAPKPITYSEALKLLEAPARIRKGEAQADLAATRAAKAQMKAPIDVRDALLKFFPLLAKDAKLRKPGGGKRRISKEDLEEFREEVMSGSDRSRAFFDSQANSLTTQASKLNQLTVNEVRQLSEKEIVEQYGSDLKQYLRDIRDAKTDAAATAALNKAKQKAKSSMEARADKYRKSSKRLAQIGAQLRLARIQKDEKAKEKLIREANDILMSIQQDM